MPTARQLLIMCFAAVATAVLVVAALRLLGLEKYAVVSAGAAGAAAAVVTRMQQRSCGKGEDAAT